MLIQDNEMIEKKELKKKKYIYISLMVISTLFFFTNIFLLYFNVCLQYRGCVDPDFDLYETIRLTILAFATYVSALAAIIISLRDVTIELNKYKIAGKIIDNN